MNAVRRRAIFERLQAIDPEPGTELVYRTPFQLLVAVILSAQATDRSVNAATGPLFAAAGTPEQFMALGEEGLKSCIKSIGLWQTKARNILATCRMLLDRHAGEVPHDRTALEALPGVGRKTANVVLSVAFGEETIAVDTHVFRVANRTGLATGRTPAEVEMKLLRNVPAEFRRHAHHWLILHGRYRCRARKPDCAACEIHDLCEWREKS